MKIAIMQPYIFPYIGYIQLVHAVDKFIFFDDVNFIKKGWINRNNILVDNKAHLFTIPINKPSQNKLINETYILNNTYWKINLLKTISTNYKKAPFFDNVFPIIENVFNSNNENISSLAIESIKSIFKYLNVKKEFELSSKYNNSNLKAQNRIINTCLMNNAISYINPIGGTSLYNKIEFEKNNINLYFIKTRDITYNQFKNAFIPNLSIIDLLMFLDKEAILEILNQYDLI